MKLRYGNTQVRMQTAMEGAQPARSRSLAIGAVAALLFTALTSTPMRAQSDADVARLIHHQTPGEVLDGTAPLLGHYEGSQKLRLAIGIQPPHMAEEEQFLEELSTPGSPQFHHFLTADEWNARFAPSAADEQKVVDWAKSQGLTVTQRYANRLLVDVEGPASAIEKAFGVTLNRYQVNGEVEFSNDRDPVLPAHLNGVVTAVMGLNSIQRLHGHMMNGEKARGADYAEGPMRADGATYRADAEPGSRPPDAQFRPTPEITNGFYDPTNIYSSEAYNYNGLKTLKHCCNPNNNPGTSPPDSSIAIAAFGVFNQSDLKGFHTQYPYLAYHDSIINIGGSTACCSDEATLDVEWSTATSNSFGAAANTAHVFFYVAANTLISTYASMYNTMLSDNHAHVMSTSWGCAEVYCWTASDIDAIHPIFNSMTGQGWTLVAAAGDGGATDDCKHTSIDYPGSDPNFVAAGGTTLELDSTGKYVSEVAWQGSTTPGSCSKNNGGSGGGASVIFSQPGYQSGIGGKWRHTPDISLNANVGQNYYYNGGLHGVGGTSIVAPELAGFFAQENAYLIAMGDYMGNHCGASSNSPCAPVGNPNPMIYQEGIHAPYAPHYPFYDITKDCNSNDVTKATGDKYYCAGKGYDLVTGWGSANMLQLAWAINTWLAWDGGGPKASFSGPKTGQTYHSNQTVSWKLSDTSASAYPKNGVAGYTAKWDSDPGDVYSESTPGSGNSFYSGPAHGGSSGSATFSSSLGTGCHTLHVRAWDNAGTISGDMTYGPLCYSAAAK